MKKVIIVEDNLKLSPLIVEECISLGFLPFPNSLRAYHHFRGNILRALDEHLNKEKKKKAEEEIIKDLNDFIGNDEDVIYIIDYELFFGDSKKANGISFFNKFAKKVEFSIFTTCLCIKKDFLAVKDFVEARNNCFIVLKDSKGDCGTTGYIKGELKDQLKKFL